MSSYNDKPSDEPEPQLQKEGEILLGLDEKLADLMQMGWTLIAESCPLEKCHCPLLRSLDGNKYCVKCETWLFDKEPRKQKFTDLVVKGVQDLELKELGFVESPKKNLHKTQSGCTIDTAFDVEVKEPAKKISSKKAEKKNEAKANADSSKKTPLPHPDSKKAKVEDEEVEEDSEIEDESEEDDEDEE